jgi:hypothetical protein
MNTTSRASDRGVGDRLELPACPICHEKSSPSRQQASIGGTDYVWYECGACGSALLSLGAGRWAYQKITRPGHEHLLCKPMTLPELRRLLPELAPPRPAAAVTFPERTAPAQPAPPPTTPRVETSPPGPAAFPRVEAASPAPEPYGRVAAAPRGRRGARIGDGRGARGERGNGPAFPVRRGGCRPHRAPARGTRLDCARGVVADLRGDGAAGGRRLARHYELTPTR